MYVPYEEGTTGEDTRPFIQQVAILSRDFAWIPDINKNQKTKLEITKQTTVLNLHTFYGWIGASTEAFNFVNYKGNADLKTRINPKSNDPEKFSLIHTSLNSTPYTETRKINQKSVIAFFAAFGGIMRLLEV